MTWSFVPTTNPPPTHLEVSSVREGNAPRRSQPPSSRRVKKDVLGAGSGPGGTASPCGVENVKPVPVQDRQNTQKAHEAFRVSITLDGGLPF